MNESETSKDWWDDLPRTKLPNEFTGNGTEIIGDPEQGGGEIWYRDGHCISILSEKTRSKPSKITPSKEIAWFHLTRRNRLQEPNGPDLALERRDRKTAEMLGGEFVEALLEGRLVALMKSVTRALEVEAKRRKNRELGKPEDGHRDALHMVARKHPHHPDQVTVSAVLDFLKEHPDLCKNSGITPSMLTCREVRRRLGSIGFGWLPSGRKRGRPRAQK